MTFNFFTAKEFTPISPAVVFSLQFSVLSLFKVTVWVRRPD